MSSCESIREDLDAYRDEILASDRYREIECHLHHCITCSEEMNRAAAMEQYLRDSASNWVPADRLWTRIRESAALRGVPRGLSPPKYLVRLPWAIAALLLLTISILGVYQLQDDELGYSNSVASALVNEFHTFVVSQRKLDYAQTQPLEIRKWFGNKVDFRAPLPLQAKGFQLAGGRLCNMLEQRVAAYMYQANGAWISLYIMKSSASASQRPGQEYLLQGYGYIAWEKDGLHYSLVGDIPVDRLRQFALALNSSQARLGDIKPGQNYSI